MGDWYFRRRPTDEDIPSLDDCYVEPDARGVFVGLLAVVMGIEPKSLLHSPVIMRFFGGTQLKGRWWIDKNISENTSNGIDTSV